MKILYRLLERLTWKVGDFLEAKGSFPFGNCIVSYSFTDKGDDIEVYNPVKDTYLDNIAEWLILNAPDRAMSNQWNDNGFRSEADYLNYKFG